MRFEHQVHRHMLICEDLGIKIVLLCRHAEFDWRAWMDECTYNLKIPSDIRTVGLLLLASGIGLEE